MPVTVTGKLVNARGEALPGALVTFFPLNAPFVDPDSADRIVTSALVRTRSAADGAFSQVVVGGTESRRTLYRVEFAERDRLKLSLTTNSGSVNIGTIFVP